MQIKLNLYLFLFIILFLLTNQLEMYALMMVFALLHESAHLLCGILLGFEPDTFKIMPLGFSITFQTKVEDYNYKIKKSNILSIKKIIIALAGPFFNLIMVVIGIVCRFNQSIIYANLLIFLCNMLPIYPLDGGRILKNILKIFFGNRKAHRYCNRVSNIIAIVLTIVASIAIYIYQNIAIFFIMMFLWWLVLQENKRQNTYNKIYKIIDKSHNYI